MRTGKTLGTLAEMGTASARAVERAIVEALDAGVSLADLHIEHETGRPFLKRLMLKTQMLVEVECISRAPGVWTLEIRRAR